MSEAGLPPRGCEWVLHAPPVNALSFVDQVGTTAFGWQMAGFQAETIDGDPRRWEVTITWRKQSPWLRCFDRGRVLWIRIYRRMKLRSLLRLCWQLVRYGREVR